MDLSSTASTIIVSTLLALATWTYHKIKGDKTDDFTDLVKGIGKQIVDELVRAGGTNADVMRAQARAFMLSAMKRLGIPDNAISEAIVTATIEHAVGDAQEEIRQTTTAMNNAITALQASAQTLATHDFNADAQRGRDAVKDMSDLIEVVPPDSPATEPPTKESQP